MFNGEFNAENLDNWIWQLEVYLRIQNLHDDDTKIQLASLRMEGATLVWWEAKTKEEINRYDKITLSWTDFITAIKQKIYPLAHMQKAIMNWKNFRQLKGQNVQEYTQEFRRRALLLGVDLQSQDDFLKYIGGLHCYLKHIILMLNPTILDEVCVQATHLEARGKNITDEGRKKPFKGKNKEKTSKGKGKNNTSLKKEGEKLVCKHCSKEGHDENHCWKLHPEMRPKKYNNKGKQKNAATTQHDLGYDLGDESKITAKGLKNIKGK